MTVRSDLLYALDFDGSQMTPEGYAVICKRLRIALARMDAVREYDCRMCANGVAPTGEDYNELLRLLGED